MTIWNCEIAMLWSGDYWDTEVIQVTAPSDILYMELDDIAREQIYERDDDMMGCYLYNYWREED